MGRIGGKFSTIFCNRIKIQDVGTTKKGGGEGRLDLVADGKRELRSLPPPPTSCLHKADVLISNL